MWIALGTLLVIVLGLAIWLYTPDKPRAALEALYAGPPSQFVEAAGMRLHVRDTHANQPRQHADLLGTLAALHPERVERLVLLAPDGFASPGFTYETAPKVPPLLRLLPYVMPTFLLRASLVPAYADSAMVTDTLVRRYRDMLLAPGVRGAILDRTAQAVLVGPVPLLRRIATPVLLLWGREDRMIPMRNADDYMAALPDARLMTFPGVGHVLHEEAADQTAEAIRNFLNDESHVQPDR